MWKCCIDNTDRSPGNYYLVITRGRVSYIYTLITQTFAQATWFIVYHYTDVWYNGSNNVLDLHRLLLQTIPSWALSLRPRGLRPPCLCGCIHTLILLKILRTPPVPSPNNSFTNLRSLLRRDAQKLRSLRVASPVIYLAYLCLCSAVCVSVHKSFSDFLSNLPLSVWLYDTEELLPLL